MRSLPRTTFKRVAFQRMSANSLSDVTVGTPAADASDGEPRRALVPRAIARQPLRGTGAVGGAGGLGVDGGPVAARAVDPVPVVTDATEVSTVAGRRPGQVCGCQQGRVRSRDRRRDRRGSGRSWVQTAQRRGSDIPT